MGRERALPFLKDVEMQVRLLVAVPLLVVAELVVHRRMRPVVGAIRGPGPHPGFGAATIPRRPWPRRCACAIRSGPKLLLIAVVYVVGVGIVWRTQMRSTWRAGAARR